MVQPKQTKPLAKQTKPIAKFPMWHLGLVFVSAFLLYANTLKNGYTLDDDIYTKKNRFVQEGFKNGIGAALKNTFAKGSLVGFNNANESNYRPLVVLNFVADTAFFGNSPGAEHFFNILLYGLSCVILLLWLQKVFKKFNPLFALAITLVFVFHPVHTEVVASIKSRDEILGWFFGLLSFYNLFVYIENTKRKRYFYYSLLFFTASILCKENSLTFVLVVPLMLYYFSEVSLNKILSISSPFLGLIVLYMVVRIGVLDSITFKDKIVVMNNGLMAAKSGGEMLATNFVILGKYLWLMIFPVDLTWDYSFNQVPIVKFKDWHEYWKALLSLVIYLGMGAYVILKFKKKDVYVFAILFYLITLFLSSNLVVKIGATMGERFLFVPSLGFCMVLVMGLLALLKVDLRSLKWVKGAQVFVILGILLALYSFKTFDRNKAWANNFDLFVAGLDVSTGSARAHYAVASEYRVRGEAERDPVKRAEDFRLSVSEYDKGIKIYPDDAEVWYNLGVTYFDQGDTANARRVYAKAIELRPNYSMAMNNTGVIFFNQKKYKTALGYFLKIMQTDSAFTDALGNIGACYHNSGNYKLAAGYYEKALQKDPYNKGTLNNISLVYKALGDTAKANSYLQRAASIR